MRGIAANSARHPVRIQRRRTKGWRMPAGAVYVGRPTKWGNPWRLEGWQGAFVSLLQLGERGDKAGMRAAAVKLYRLWITQELVTIDADPERVGAWASEIAKGINMERAAGEDVTATTIPDVSELRGKDLVCWCPLVDTDGNPVPCHADVLLELANG